MQVRILPHPLKFYNMKRFKIIDPSNRTFNTKYDTLEEVVKDLTSSDRDYPQQTYYIECLVDDIIINAEDLIEAWNEGERPQDLQFF